MCGIAGYYGGEVTQDQRSRILYSLQHRGPDANGAYTHNDVGLLHTRLSILDLSDLGAQPYHFDDLVLVYNGELYNYPEVRSELARHGYSFQSNSDTEVLIKAFHLWKEKCISRFVGMFAFCIYDRSAD